MEPILAYIDPGSGSLVIQALIAGIVVIPVLFRRQVSRIVQTLRGGAQPTAEATRQDDVTKGA